MRRLRVIVTTGLLLLGLTACGGGTPSLVGQWRADDGTGVKIINSSGACSGMYYTGSGRSLDIGGGMSCSMSSKKDDNGRYALVVSQPPNQETLRLAFDGNDRATVYLSGERLFTMTRQ